MFPVLQWPCEEGTQHNYFYRRYIIMPRIISDDCLSCGSCAAACPCSAIDMCDEHYMVDPDLCVDCGACEEACPVGAISEA